MSGYWDVVLEGCGFAGTRDRRQAVAEVLVVNDFGRWCNLRHAEHPSNWLRVDVLRTDEVTFLCEVLIRRAPIR